VADTVADIDAGIYRPGERIPSIREMSRRKRVAVNTVRLAYEILVSDLVIEARPRSGYFVLMFETPAPVRPRYLQAKVHNRSASTSGMWRAVHAETASNSNLGLISLEESDLPSKALIRAVSRAGRVFPRQCVASGDPRGLHRLRRQLSLRYGRVDCALEPAEILVTGGCSQGLFLALTALTQPGQSVIVEQPFFSSALQLWESLGLNIMEIPAHPQTGIDVDLLKEALSNNTVAACVVVSSFSNPLGSSLTEEKRAAVAALAEAHDVPVIEDDIFGELFFSGERPRPVKSFDRSGHIILVSSFSKWLAPGFRTGWIAPGRYRRHIEALKTSVHDTPAVAIQIALADVMESGDVDRHLRKLRIAYALQMREMVRCVQEHFPEGTRINVPRGGLVLWVELPNEVDATRLAATARAHGITLLPGPLFTLTGRFQNAVRLNFSHWNAATRSEVDQVGKLAREQTGEP